MSDKLSGDEIRAYQDFLAHGGTPVVIPPAPMVEEPDWMCGLDEIYDASIISDEDLSDPTRPYEPCNTSEQDWRDTWR